MNRWIHRTPEPTGRGAVARSPRRTRLPICMPMSRRANTVKAAPICGGRACIRQRMAQATRRRGAGGQTARREGWQAHRRTGRDRAAHPRTRSRKQAVAHHRGRPGHHGKSTRSLGVTVRESGLRRAAQEALTETFAMLTGDGVSTRQAATLTGLVRSTATRRRNAATALTPAVCTEPAVEPANKLTDAERRRVVEVLTSDRFVDLAPLQIYAQLLDEGVYLCS